MLAKTLWRSLTDKGLWRLTIGNKYFKKISTTHWLWNHQPGFLQVSVIWSSIYSSFDLIGLWLKWNIGNGDELFVGVDPYMDDGGDYRLPDVFIKDLQERQVSVLSQIFLDRSVLSSEGWLTAGELNLPQHWHDCWGNYIARFSAAGIKFNSEPNSLTWDGPGGNGILNVKNLYNVLERNTPNPHLPRWWHRRLWKWNIPPKLRLFIWLCFHNKILTWCNIQKRGFNGPGRCVLCKSEGEDIHHLFIHCRFVQLVWQVIRDKIYAPDDWKGSELEDCIRNWLKAHGPNSTIPFFVIESIWKVRNTGIFENLTPDVHYTTGRILYHWSEFPERKCVDKIRRVIHPVMEEDHVFGFFDGASQRGLCGGGIWFRFSNTHSFHLHVMLGEGDGLKAELLALRCLLWCAWRKGINHLFIFCDSLLVVSWFNGSYAIRAIILDHWMEDVNLLRTSFDHITCRHIYREANTIADHLSKDDIGPLDGFIHYSELEEKATVDQGQIRCF